MGRKKKDKKEEELVDDNWWQGVKAETKKAVLAIVFGLLALFFVFASFGAAGMAGEKSYQFLHWLFGEGFYVLPVALGALAFSFLRNGAITKKYLIIKSSGGVLLFVSLICLASLIAPNSGGVVGNLLQKPLVEWFDLYLSALVLIALAVIAILILFDTHLSLDGKIFGFQLWGKKPEDLESEDDNELNAEEEENLKIPEPMQDDEEEEDDIPSRPEPRPSPSAAPALGGLINWSKTKSHGAFVPPPLSLLEKDSGRPGVGDVKANANIIKRTLSNFGISVEMDEVSIGPSVTRYALKPSAGMKLSRIVNLQNELSLALAAHPIRIEAPIPGKSLVGIEIPNSIKTKVGLASLIGTADFDKSPYPLLLSMGRGVSGVPYFANLAKAPHILIAGATGSGKSVTIHTLITSLLYRNPPDRMRFIMIDPKRVELTLYNKIPHLLTPVITDAKKAIAALRWAAGEMDRRYNILEENAVRDIESYHKNILEPALKSASSDDEIERMPYIVIIIDELADIMTTYPRELESSIVRLAQMSRAVGIHLVLSTQRPSVEVITGLIKANVPARVALQVASQIDSRTILDMAGAEKLLGAGDMLYLGGEMSKPVRLQSAFIGETEVKKVVDWLAKQYADAVPDAIDFSGGNENALVSTALDGGSDEDELYEQAREEVLRAGKASASFLQRRLKVGYARAARLLDILEDKGVIGPGEGAKPREVYGADSYGKATDDEETDL